MNIVRALVHKKVLTAFLVVGGSYAGMKYALSIDRFLVLCDQALDVEVQQQVKKLVEKTPLEKASALCDELQRECPAVVGVVIERRASGIALVRVKGHVPCVKIVSGAAGYKEYCLCQGGTVLEKNYFAEQVLGGMARVQVEGPDFEEKMGEPGFKKCLLGLKPSMFAEFDITWRSKSEIILRSAQLLIVADEVTVHDQERMGYVKRILGAEAEKYKHGMKADIRLQDSLVCSGL